MLECQGCHRDLNAKTPFSWDDPRFVGINQCRAAFFCDYVRLHPGLSTWEISEQSGLNYGAALKAVEKAKRDGALRWDVEETNKGQRYRFTDADPIDCYSATRSRSRLL
jgi:hypothetical protein